MKTPQGNNPQTILVAAWNDGLVAITSDGQQQEISDKSVRGLASDGRGGALAIVGGHELQHRTSAGQWTTLASSDAVLSCCVAARGVVYIGTEEARMLRLNDQGVLESLDGFDNIAERDTWFAGSAIVNGERVGPPLGIRSMSANADGSILFANVHVGGIPRSLDGGRSWQPTIDIHSDVHQVCAHPTDPNLVVAASATGLCISRDRGATWTIARDGLHAPHCSAVAFSGEYILVSAATDPFTKQSRLYRRPIDPQGELTLMADGLPAWLDGNVDTDCIATNSSVVAVVDKAGTLYLSTTSGATWSRGTHQLTSPSSVLIC